MSRGLYKLPKPKPIEPLPDEEEVELVWKEMYVCPFCSFNTRIRDVMFEHLKQHVQEVEVGKFNPSER